MVKMENKPGSFSAELYRYKAFDALNEATKRNSSREMREAGRAGGGERQWGGKIERKVWARTASAFIEEGNLEFSLWLRRKSFFLFSTPPPPLTYPILSDKIERASFFIDPSVDSSLCLWVTNRKNHPQAFFEKWIPNRSSILSSVDGRH